MKEEIKEILDNANKDTKFKMVDENGAEKEMNLAGFIEQLLNDNKSLLDYITNLQEGNNNLKEDFKRHIDRINELTERSDNLQEIERLNNIINELEKDIKNLYTYGIKNNAEQKDYLLNRLDGLRQAKELKGE